MASHAILALALLAFIPLASFFALSRAGDKLDPREPPEVKSTIPVLGHLFGLLSKGVSYYYSLSLKNPDLPAFTVNIPQAKTYIITSPELLAAVQRNARNISFEPLLGQATERIAGCSPETVNKIRPLRSGGGGGAQDVVHAMHPALLGDGLDDMNETMARNLKVSLDELAADSNEPTTIDLLDWCKDAITIASTDSNWGPLNPYKSKFLRDCFWELDNGLGRVVLNFAPHIIAHKPWKARETLVKAFTAYLEARGYEQGSMLAKARYTSFSELGVPIEDIARQEVGMGFGLLSNTIPSTFWFLFDLYSRPDVLVKVREEVRANALHIITEDSQSAIIDLADIRDQCPLLVSTFQESLRFRANGAPTRYVFEDTLLDGKYLLKKGSTLQMSAAALHGHPSSWGRSAAEFEPSRFLKSNARRTGGFVGFGVSPSICPGRHFASSEILIFTAAVILRFDFTPTSSSSPSSPSFSSWIEPPLNYALAASATPPGKPFYVKATPRDEYKGYEWDFRVTRGKGQFGLVIG